MNCITNMDYHSITGSILAVAIFQNSNRAYILGNVHLLIQF